MLSDRERPRSVGDLGLVPSFFSVDLRRLRNPTAVKFSVSLSCQDFSFHLLK